MSLAFTEKGSKQHPTLILIHAFPVNQSMWKKQVEGLADAFRVVTLDMPGFGQSPRLHGTPSLTLYVQEILETIGSLNIGQAIFGGCSMGGYIVFQLYKEHPHRFKGMLLCDTKATADSEEARQNRYNAIQMVQDHGLNSLADGMLPKLMGTTTHQTNPELVQTLHNCILTNTPEGVCQAQEAMAKRDDFTPLLATITVPTLIVNGEEDEFTPPSLAQEMQILIPNAQLAIIPQAGHLAAWERPQETNQEIRAFFAGIQ
ncbi:MAG: alpha/beta fold hydrolase [bacterium]|jgi:pimeloyl-ACP methyl ester carboxylesterase|nr:alpha/beta fold hydrolase [bacterium]